MRSSLQVWKHCVTNDFAGSIIQSLPTSQLLQLRSVATLLSISASTYVLRATAGDLWYPSRASIRFCIDNILCVVFLLGPFTQHLHYTVRCFPLAAKFSRLDYVPRLLDWYDKFITYTFSRGAASAFVQFLYFITVRPFRPSSQTVLTPYTLSSLPCLLKRYGYLSNSSPANVCISFFSGFLHIGTYLFIKCSSIVLSACKSEFKFFCCLVV